MLYIQMVFYKNTHSWRAKWACVLIAFIHCLAGVKASVRQEEWRERIELFNDVSFAWKVSGRCSPPTYARQTDRQVDSYEDRWMMQRLQHWGKWDQMLTARWTDPWSGLQMFSHIYHHMVCECILLDEPCSHSAICKFVLFFFFFAFPCMLCNMTEFGIICALQQVAWDKRFTSNNLAEDLKSPVSAAMLQICNVYFIIHNTEPAIISAEARERVRLLY